MKIFCVGSHGGGKSTLARYISNKYNLPFLPETARLILSEKELQIDQLRSDLTTADDYQRSIFNRQLLEEKKYNEFCGDRSLIDVLAYSGQHTRILPELLQRPELLPYIESLKLPSTILFFVRPCKQTMVADGVREILNWDGVIAIDAQIKLLLEMWNIRYFAINTDNMQERIRIVDSVINLYKKE
jgi:nicotinamide riboside kinase